MPADVVGVRVMPNKDGFLSSEAIMQPSTYGRCSAERVKGTRAGWWQVTAPDGCVGSINPTIHTVTEFEDGTITVVPSLDFSKRKPGGWHGFLTRGVFRSV